MNNTAGLGCGQCSSGYFGEPANNGTCSECACGKHSSHCDSRSGKCFCGTKGVVGDRCDRCEYPKYIGMPHLPDGTCFYNLNIDYQFTFNLNRPADRHFTRINFMNPVEESAEDDIDFIIRCYKSEALFNVTFVVDYEPALVPVESGEWPFSLLNNITSYIFYANRTEYGASSALSKPSDRDR
jgi:hypothetical protein